jgi:hypothetical protein
MATKKPMSARAMAKQAAARKTQNSANRKFYKEYSKSGKVAYPKGTHAAYRGAFGKTVKAGGRVAAADKAGRAATQAYTG